MNFFISLCIVLLGLWGINLSIWGIVGLMRLISDRYRTKGPAPFGPEEVAVLIPAHNEERVIYTTIEGALQVVPAQNIHVITSDFPDKDATALLARTYGVKVLELPEPLSKAHKLEAGVWYFNMARRYKAVLFVDADTVLASDYLTQALPYFADPNVAAVAGHATTLWRPEENPVGSFFLSYRERFYFFLQHIIKFGQAWKYINVMPIVPGFASVYRSSVLPDITINAPGLIIEDFNMTFEVHRKQLGRVVYSPKIRGYTQDPNNLKDYFKQIRRWNLGFWQTIYRHGYWPGLFWLALAFYVFEGIMSAIFFLLLPFTIVLVLLEFGTHIPIQFTIILASLFIGDYLLTFILALIKNQPKYLFYGLGYIFLRFVDSVAYLYSIPKAIFEKSSGLWVSPARR